MAVKKDIKAWAIRLRGRSFHQDRNGVPIFYATKSEASFIVLQMERSDLKAAPVRVKVRVEVVE